MPRLTKKLIDEAVAVGDDIKLWDDKPRGLGVRVKPSGTKSFFVRFTSPETGKKVQKTIAQYGRITLEQARTEARKMMGLVASGVDPQQEDKRAKKKRASMMTVAEFCDRYMEDAKAGKVRYRGRAKKTSTIATDAGRVERHIKPLLGKRPMGDVTKADIEAWANDVRNGKTATEVKTKPRGLARVLPPYN